MSAGLVRRWRRVARQWEQCAASLSENVTAEQRARYMGYAQAFRECAESLERSNKIRAKREAKL